MLTLLLVVGAVSCSPLPSDPSSLPTSLPATHLETPVHSVEVSHEVRHVSVEVNEHPFELSITSDQDAGDSTAEQEPPPLLPSNDPTSPYNIRHLGFTPTGFIDTLHPVYSHPTPPKIIEAKDNVHYKKQDEEVVADAAIDAADSTPETSLDADTFTSHDSESDNSFPQPDGEPEDEYIGLELDEPLKDIADQISVISDQAKNIWEPIQDDVSKNFDDTVKSISDTTNDAFDDTVKSISRATNEAKNILEPIHDHISKNIEETIKSINEASDEHINSASDSIKNAVNYIKTAAEPIASDDLNIFSTTESETDFFEDINEDFEIIGEKDEPIESDYERIDDAFEFLKDEERIIVAEARVGSEEIMKKVNPGLNSNINKYEEFGDHREANIEKKDNSISEHTLEADSLNNIPKDDSHIETMPTEDTTEAPVLLENPPQEDQPALDLDQDKKHEVEKEPIESIPKDIIEDESKTKEQPQVDQPLVAKDQDENEMFIDAVKRSDTGTEILESPQENKPLEDATLSESTRKSRVYIEKVDGIPKEKPVDSEDASKDIPEDPVQDVPEISEEDSAQESSVATSPISNVNHEEDLAHPKEPHGDAKMATDIPIESIEKETELSHDIPIDITKNEEISKNKEASPKIVKESTPKIVKESTPKIVKESTLNNNVNEEEIIEENVEDVQSSGDEHVDEEIPVINEDGRTINEAEEPVDEATEAVPVIPSGSGDTADAEYVDPAAAEVPLPDPVITHHETTEHETSPLNPGIAHPKADQNDQVHHHKLSASDNVILPPSLERVSIAEPHPLSAGAIVGIFFGVLMISGFIVGIAGFIVYQRRFHIRPKTLNSDRGYAGSDSGGYIDDDQVRVSYVNSQTDMPKGSTDSTDRTFRLRLNTQD